MTKEEFIKVYCEKSGIPWEKLRDKMRALPCACGDESCKGWAMVNNNGLSLKAHFDLYAPNEQLCGGPLSGRPNERSE